MMVCNLLHFRDFVMIFFIDKTWRGEIGVRFNTQDDEWDVDTFSAIMESLNSCFRNPDDISFLS
jgi:hypothetical protein